MHIDLKGKKKIGWNPKNKNKNKSCFAAIYTLFVRLSSLSSAKIGFKIQKKKKTSSVCFFFLFRLNFLNGQWASTPHQFVLALHVKAGKKTYKQLVSESFSQHQTPISLFCIKMKYPKSEQLKNTNANKNQKTNREQI